MHEKSTNKTWRIFAFFHFGEYQYIHGGTQKNTRTKTIMSAPAYIMHLCVNGVEDEKSLLISTILHLLI